MDKDVHLVIPQHGREESLGWIFRKSLGLRPYRAAEYHENGKNPYRMAEARIRGEENGDSISFLYHGPGILYHTMPRIPEKNAISRFYAETGEPSMTLLALASLLTAMGAGIATASLSGDSLGAWHIRSYAAIADMVFDCIFTVEFFLVAFSSRNRQGRDQTLSQALAGLSSVIPLALASGPLLIGWAQGDFSCAAVRGYYSYQGTLAALAAVSYLRLLRAARPFLPLQGSDYHSRSRVRSCSKLLLPPLLILMVAALLVDGLILPGYAQAERDRRIALIRVLDTQGASEEELKSHADVAALRRGGRVLRFLHKEPGIGDLAYIREGDTEAWFALEPFHAARGTGSAVVNAAALSFALAGWLVFKRAKDRPLDAREAASVPDGVGGRDRPIDASQNASRNASAVGTRGDKPAGKAELSGILGRALR